MISFVIDLERGDADHRESTRQPELPLGGEDDRDHAEQEAHVLAHEQEHEADRHDRTAPSAIERVDQPCDERHRERDLVEVGLDDALQRPPEQVRRGGHERESRPEAALAERVHREGRCSDQDAEDEPEHARVRPDPEQRRQDREDRAEVVAEQREPDALERADRRLEPGVVPDRLIEDADVVPGRRVGVVALPVEGRVDAPAEHGESRQDGAVGVDAHERDAACDPPIGEPGTPDREPGR